MKTVMKKNIEAIIEKSPSGGLSIYAPDIEGVYGYGLNEDEAKADFREVLEEQAEYFHERKGQYPQWYSDDLSIAYTYDVSGFFEAFPCINASQFAKMLGINQSLMRKYKSRVAGASAKQKEILQQGLNKFVARLQEVRF